MNEKPGTPGVPEASELLLCQDNRLVCETYIFEPVATEATLGRLYVAAEVEDRQGVGKELLDLCIQTLQLEYYREPSRSVTASFESALHQANIVLHDATEQGVRDWMGYWHVTVAVVADMSLYICTAGSSQLFLVRKGKASLLTEDLSYSPITDPLRTFSQVASGALAPRDVLFLGTSSFSQVFRREDLLRFSAEHSAQTIRTRLEQLYADQQSTRPLAAIVISLLPRHIAVTRPVLAGQTEATSRRPRRRAAALVPRKPLVIHRTNLLTLLMLSGRMLVAVGRWLGQRGWPLLVHGSRLGGRVVVSASVLAKRNVKSAVTAQTSLGGRVRRLGRVLWHWAVHIPRTSKIFATVSAVLALTLVISIILLQSKRTDDATIQQASEALHDAQTKLAAAETALIYDNRDQARELVGEAVAAGEDLLKQNVYTEEAAQLVAAGAIIQDRLQKVWRASAAGARVIGDWATLLGGQEPGGLAVLDERLFSFNPRTNEILALTLSGETQTVSSTSQGVGAFKLAIAHGADKNIIYISDAGEVAILDTKTDTVSVQEVSLGRESVEVAAAAVYGSRLYTTEAGGNSIYSYNKTLRGFAGRSAWLTEEAWPADTVVSLAVDGSIYTLHNDGRLRELFKGKAVAFEAEPVDPPLAGARRVLTAESFKNLYVFDPERSRVVVFTKKGELVQQVVLDVGKKINDVAVAEDERTLYILDGTAVLALPLGVQTRE